jgi:hypothetical protein
MVFQPGLKSLQRTEGVDNCPETWHVNARLVYKSATAVSFSVLSSSRKNKLWAVPWQRSLVAGLSPRRPGFAPGSIYVGFVVDKVTLGQVFLLVLLFSPVNIIPPSLSKLISSGECVMC